jgi:hypothetical protein
MDIIKKIPTIHFTIQNEWNGATSVCGNKTVNSPVLIFHTGL